MNFRDEGNHQEWLEAILNNAVDAIISIDSQGMIKSANPATETLFGYSAEELIDQNIKILMPQPFRGEHDAYIRSYLESGQKKIIGIGREVLGMRKDGSVFPVHLAVSELKLGDHLFFTGIIRDISDVKEVEAKLVQNERLAAIGQMVAGLAHESRNAFQRSHACLANLALDVKDMPESLDLVQKTQKALDHLNSLLEEVRDYSAPIQIKRSPTDIESVLYETWHQIKSAKSNDGEILFKIKRTADFPTHLSIDRVRLGQVIWNLLENARAACPKNLGQVEVRLSVPADASAALLEVHDNGEGIDPEHRQHIFEPFFTTKTKGTGLGLAISRRIVDAHDGQLGTRQSTLGGACFTLQLPLS